MEHQAIGEQAPGPSGPQVIGVALSPPLSVRPLGKAKFNYQLSSHCRPQKLLVPPAVADSLLVTRVLVGDVSFDGEEVSLSPFERNGKLFGYELVLPETEAARGQQLSVFVTNKTRKVALFYVIAVLAIIDEQKLLAAVGHGAEALAEKSGTPLLGQAEQVTDHDESMTDRADSAWDEMNERDGEDQ